MCYVPDFVGQASKLAKMNPKRFGASHIRTVEEQSLPIITGCQDFFALGRNFNLSPLFRQRRRRLFQKSSSLHKSRKKRRRRERRRNGPSQFYWHWLKVISKAAYRTDSQPSKKSSDTLLKTQTAYVTIGHLDFHFKIFWRISIHENKCLCLFWYPWVYLRILKDWPLRWKMGQGSKIFSWWCVW